MLNFADMADAAKILVVDQNPKTSEQLKTWFKNSDHRFFTVEAGPEAIELIESTQFDAVLSEFRLQGLGGYDLVKQAKTIRPNLPVIIIAEKYDSRTAIEAVKAGAFDFLPKPLDETEVHRSLEVAIESARSSEKTIHIGKTPTGDQPVDSLVGQSRAMLSVYKALGRLSAMPVTVLIQGETGTGKELVARALYQHGHRSHKPFITINCAAIPENLLESELFGHEKGAFTGAVTTRVGKFEQAHNATLFLDEIGDMDLSLQAKLLRILQEKRFQRVGGSEEITVDVRIIAATHRDLQQMVYDKTFREDLYYRLNVAQISLPPLRDRVGDIALLSQFFLERFCIESSLPQVSISQTALARLEQGSWPGNVRQLQNVIRKAALNARGYPIDEANIRSLMEEQNSAASGPENFNHTIAELLHANNGNAHKVFLEKFEAHLFNETLNETNGNLSRAAEWLGISRFTLREKLKQYGLRE